ncbi:hypothetical protein E3N88_14172 [Mikania micrantha]|uniref:Uncharacterized protein n=1 Tax=Mikania micrantha TaxID=192012 RepID=A0A5N6P118_9ASTR|nr:hypothetical protein E3N88_14172 [Mikania micrantha]
MAPLVKLESWSTWILKLEEASEGKESQKKNSPLNSRAPCSTFPPPHHCTNGQSDESMSQESQALVMKTRRLLIDGEDEAVMERSYIRSLEMTNTEFVQPFRNQESGLRTGFYYSRTDQCVSTFSQ